MTLNLLAVGIVALNIIVALSIYFILDGRDELPMLIGVLYGAVTNTTRIRCCTRGLDSTQL